MKKASIREFTDNLPRNSQEIAEKELLKITKNTLANLVKDYPEVKELVDSNTRLKAENDSFLDENISLGEKLEASLLEIEKLEDTITTNANKFNSDSKENIRLNQEIQKLINDNGNLKSELESVKSKANSVVNEKNLLIEKLKDKVSYYESDKNLKEYVKFHQDTEYWKNKADKLQKQLSKFRQNKPSISKEEITHIIQEHLVNYVAGEQPTNSYFKNIGENVAKLLDTKPRSYNTVKKYIKQYQLAKTYISKMIVYDAEKVIKDLHEKYGYKKEHVQIYINLIEREGFSI